MFPISPDQVTQDLRVLFRTDEPQAHRCFAVLDGVSAGKIITDDPIKSTWGVVWEAYEGSTFLGGSIDSTMLAGVIAHLRQDAYVLVGLWLEDPRLSLLPPDPDYDGRTLEFYDHPVGKGLESFLRQVPNGCEIRRMDRELVMSTEWGPADVRFAGGLEAWEQTCQGYCLMRNNEILSEASTGPAAIGLREPGVFTQEAHRGKGYATLTAAYLIRELEVMSDQTYWNCAKQNLPSARVARKLGYRVEKEYRLLAWNKLPE
jgi:RimJ/RimL family protein N-acetyltransferase